MKKILILAMMFMLVGCRTNDMDGYFKYDDEKETIVFYDLNGEYSQQLSVPENDNTEVLERLDSIEDKILLQCDKENLSRNFEDFIEDIFSEDRNLVDRNDLHYDDETYILSVIIDGEKDEEINVYDLIDDWCE